MDEGSQWTEPLRLALEAVRMEAQRRLHREGFPSSVLVSQTVVIENDEGNGWRSEDRTVQASGLRDPAALAAIRDESPGFWSCGFREQLEPLAGHLDEATALGRAEETGILPGLTGVEAILNRYLAPLATRYLIHLADVAVTDDALTQRLAEELSLLARGEVVETQRLAVSGVRPEVPLHHHGVSLRRLTPEELGALLEREGRLLVLPEPRAELMLPTQLAAWLPSALLEVRSVRERGTQVPPTALLDRLVLAFLLNGTGLGTAGAVTRFHEPSWASLGHAYHPFPVAERFESPALINEDQFADIVEVALAMPALSGGEADRPTIVLARTLKGAGARFPRDGFLDIAIALEAALLAGAKTELSYRFSLYGALFLREEYPPLATFGRLKQIYKLRSDLVHGSVVKPAKLQEAARDARELCLAIVRRALANGWPDAALLDQEAMGHAALPGPDNQILDAPQGLA